MTDRKKLEEAVDWFRSELKAGAAWRPDIMKHGNTIFEAAEAHLASLPKPMWKVRVWRGVTDAYECHEWAYWSEAYTDLGAMMHSGARKVEIEVP